MNFSESEKTTHPKTVFRICGSGGGGKHPRRKCHSIWEFSRWPMLIPTVNGRNPAPPGM